MFVSTATASTLLDAFVLTSTALLTVISCWMLASESTSRCAPGARAPTRTRVDADLKPSNRARSSYCPARTLSKRNAPPASASTVCAIAPAEVARSTMAPGSTAPVWSCTVPVTMVPLTAVCAPACPASATTRTTAHGSLRITS